MRRAIALNCAAALLALHAPAFAETVAITGGRVVIGDESAPIDNGTVLLRDGRVIAAGADVVVPAGAHVIDASGRWVTPGIFAGFSRVGLIEVEAVDQTSDSVAAKSLFSAALDISPAINPDRNAFAVNRAAGVTRAVVAPAAGGSIFAGEGAIADLGADFDAVTHARAFQFVELGERGAAKAGGSRAAALIQFRAMLREVADRAAGRSAFDDELLRAEDAAALQRVLAGEVPLLVHVENAHDILQVLALGRAYPRLRLVLVGASEGWRVAERIAAAKVPVIASALNDLPERFETLAATQSNLGRMKQAGVTVAIGMIDDEDSHQLRYSLQYAGNLVAIQKIPGAAGLSWNEAFAAITGMPARIMGMDNELGYLKAGRRGDVVIWDGDPLELSSAPVTVMIDGVEQPLDNRQTRLRERYRHAPDGPLPKAYGY